MSKYFPDYVGMSFRRVLGLCVLLIVSNSLGIAQYAPDAPVLISEDTSTRALSVDPYRWRGRFPVRSQSVWNPGDETRVTLFVTNLNLMKEEGANAFRADVEDASGRTVRLTVESITPVDGYEWIYAVVVRLKTQIGDVGDVLARVTWRGMTSNRVRLAMGRLGGGPNDDPGAIPTGAPLTPPKQVEPYNPEEQRLGPLFSADRVRFMEQATFGPATDLDLRLRRIGLNIYLSEQFDYPYPTIPYPILPLFPTDPASVPGGCTGDCIRDNYTMYPLQRWFYQETMYGQDQLRRRVAWALSQIIVVSGADLQQPSWMLPYLKTLDKHAFGNYKDLLSEITLNPGMGSYLDMALSTRTNPNENFAREILQLFSVGLYKLNVDGTVQCVEHNPCLPGDTPAPTYDQNVVNGFTKVFTGWRLCRTLNAACLNTPIGAPNYIDPMEFIANNHDTTSKLLLDGVTIPAGTGASGPADMAAAINNIFNHQNVGPYISRQLIQHLVTSNPTPAYVGRVAAVFNNNGSGVRGDLKATVRAILLDPEARGDVKTDPDYGYLREPVLLASNILRQFNARAANGAAGSQSDGYINPQTVAIGQDVFRAPSVFNYYPPGYIVPVAGINAPEFFLLTTSTALRRANFVNTLVFSTIPSTLPGNTNAPFGTSIDLAQMQAISTSDATGGLLIEALNKKMMHGAMSTEMRNIITTAVLAIPSVTQADHLFRARQAIYLVATSSQYQVQR